MICILFVGVFYTEIIDTKTELDWSGLVFPHPNCVGDWIVSIWFKVLLELLVRQDGGLFQAVHSFYNFEMYVSIVIFDIMHIILADYIIWDLTDMHFHVFRFWHC